MRESLALPLTHTGVGYVHEALRFAFPRSVAPDDRLVMIIDAYFDASGTHKGSKAVSVAGFLGRPDEWAVFGIEWQAALQEWGLDVFHMADFANRLGPYRHWSEDVRRDRLNRLLGIVNRHVLGSVGTVIPIAAYDAAFTDVKARKQSGGAFSIAGVMCFDDVAELLRRQRLGGEAQVAYVYEIGDIGAGQFMKVFQDNERDPEQKRKYRLLSLRFENKRQFLPLQAADILAYELYKESPRALGIERRPARYPLTFLGAKPHVWGRVDEPHLREWAQVIGLGLEHSTGTWNRDLATPRPKRRSPGQSKHE